MATSTAEPVLQLRPYQADALAAIEAAAARGVRRQLIALPTGAGKTVVFSELIRRRGGTALILAHRDELLRQAERKLLTVAPELAMTIGFVQAGRNDVGAPIVLASVQTLASSRRLKQLPRAYKTVVVDEAHHATARSYTGVLDHVETPLVVGFTATPERHDKSRLVDVFDEITYARSLLEMIRDGYLCMPRGVRCELEDLDLSKVKVTRGEYQAEALGRALTDAHAPEHTAAAMLEHAEGRKSIVFCPTVALAAQTAAELRHQGVPAAYVSGETPADERARILEDLQAGRLAAVCNCDVLTEGYDEPSIDCIVIAAPTTSRIRYVQRVGRGLRLYPGKDDCLILDLVGVTDDLKLQSLPKLFDLKAAPAPRETIVDAVDREQREAAADDEPAEAGAVERALVGEDVDVLAPAGRDGLSWLTVGERWVIAAGKGELLVLDPEADGWRVLHVRADGARILAGGLDLGYAQGAAEETLRHNGHLRFVDTRAAWRAQEVKSGQLQYLRGLGVRETPETAGDAADLITGALARRQIARLDAALERMGAAA